MSSARRSGGLGDARPLGLERQLDGRFGRVHPFRDELALAVVDGFDGVHDEVMLGSLDESTFVLETDGGRG